MSTVGGDSDSESRGDFDSEMDWESGILIEIRGGDSDNEMGWERGDSD